jgi:hypothetical protein
MQWWFYVVHAMYLIIRYAFIFPILKVDFKLHMEPLWLVFDLWRDPFMGEETWDKKAVFIWQI